MHLSIRSSHHFIFELLNKVVGISFVKVHDVNPHQHSTLQSHETIKHRTRPTGALCNTHLKLKSREVSFAHNWFRNYPIILEFCTERGCDAVVLCAKFQNDWTTKRDAMDKRDFARLEFKMRFGRLSYIEQGPRCLHCMERTWGSSQYKDTVFK